MRRPALYSSSNRPAQGAGDVQAQPPGEPTDEAGPLSPPPPASRLSRLSQRLARHQLYLLWSVVGLLALLLAFSFASPLRNPARKLTQEDINAAVIKTLETTVLPSPGTRAYDTIIPSVVRIVGLGKDKDGKEDGERS